MAALQRFLNDPPVEGGHPGPFPSESGGLPGENEEDEYLFLVSLDAFHEKNSGHRLNGTGFKIPTSFGTQLNIPKLYREVCSRGGYDNVTESKLWKPVTVAFNLPPTATSASTQFRCYYEKLLLAYEDRYFHGQTMRGVTRRLGTGWADGGGAGGDSGGSGSGARPLKRSGSDLGVTSARQGPAKLGRPPKQPPPPPPPPAATLAMPGGALPPPPWTQGLTPTQQGALLLSLLQPSTGPYLVVPPGFETDAGPRVRLALFGGIRSEVAWALNALAVLSHDPRPGNELRVSAMPGLLDVLVACIGRVAEAPDAAAGALALAASLPRRPGPPADADDDVARAAAALEASVQLGVLQSPLSDEGVAIAAAAAAAACILRNLSYCKANVPALLAAGKPVTQAAHMLRAEAAAAERDQEPDPASSRSLDDDAAAAERGAMCGDLMDMLLNVAHAVQLTPGAAQPGAAGSAAGGSSGVDHTPARLAYAVHAALQNATPRRAAGAAELLCRLCTPGNAAGFRPGGAFADHSLLLPPLLRMLRTRDADPHAASLGAAALARLAEVPEYTLALAAAPGAAELMLDCALDARMPELAQRNALAALHCLLKLPAPPRPPALLAAEPRLAALAAGNKEDVARVAARVLCSPVFNSGVFHG